MINILFFGNSLMFYNDMPELFARIAEANGKSVNVQSITRGSATVSDFTDESTVVGAKAIPLLRNNHWDFVIIEPSRRISPFENTVKEAELSSSVKMQELVEAAGGEVVLYSVWGNNCGNAVEYCAQSPISIHEVATRPIGRKSHTRFMHEVNLEISAALGGVKVALAGYAFENSIAKYPEINLYDPDECHPSLAGSWLAAAVIYTAVFGEPVKKIPYEAGPAPAAGILEGIANETTFANLTPELN